MNETIWKFPLEVGSRVEVEMPYDARVLTVQVQYGHPVLWAVVDPDAPLVTRRFAIRPTGHPLGEVGEYVGSFQLRVHDGGFVGHVFEG